MCAFSYLSGANLIMLELTTQAPPVQQTIVNNPVSALCTKCGSNNGGPPGATTITCFNCQTVLQVKMFCP